MVSDTAFYAGMIQWIKTYVKDPEDPSEGIPVIRSQQNGPRPSNRLYCVLNLTNQLQKGHASKVVTDTSTNETRYDFMGTANLSLDFFGDGASEAATKLRATVDHELTKSIFDSVKVSPYSVGDVVNVTSLKDSRFEERARFELGLNVTFSSSEVVNWIEKAKINGKTIEV